MADLACKHCGSASFVRNGMAAGHQRYRCKACGRNFTATPARGKPPAMKALAVLLYALGNVRHHLAASAAAPRSRPAPVTWSTGRSGCSATCGNPGTSCRCATASYLSSVKCLLLRDTPVRSQPGAQQRPQALGRVDVDLA